MTPHVEDCDEDELYSSEDDDGLKEDMDALVRACKIAGKNPSDVASGNEHADDLAICVAHDPLLGDGDAVVPFTDSDDEQTDIECLKRVQELYQSSSFKPVSSRPPPPPPTLSDDDEDDVETLRAILKRFSSYDNKDSMDKMAEGDYASSLGCEGEIARSLTSKESNSGESPSVFRNATKAVNLLTGNVERQPSNVNESYKSDAFKPSELLDTRSKFPVSAQVFIDAIKKNRSFQKVLRSKMIQMKAKMEENKQLRERVKVLKDFQTSCRKRTGEALSQKRDPVVQLISTKRSPASSNSKINDKKPSAMCYGPAENAHVSNYRMVLERSPLSLERKKWSTMECDNLGKGIKQQFQEMVLQISVNRVSSEGPIGDANDLDDIIASIKDLEITPENIRKFLPKVNWDRLASMYVVGRTGAECESRWLNCEDPLINRSQWSSEEDKFLLSAGQERGGRNWFDIAASLNTNRTPFQCLARYQRSLNPSMLYSEWTEEEDSQLCCAVALFGVSNWQSVASVLERRTGTQCSNRWKKALCPERKGAFTPEEDYCLIVGVLLFGPKWSKIAKFVRGRKQTQCRERYANCLDPRLKRGPWTAEEDSRLKAAISKHGYCWSKVAADVALRTDSQCKKRLKVLCPDLVDLLKAAREMRKATVVSNFVDRESERPSIFLNDFRPLAILGPSSEADEVKLARKRKSKLSNISKTTGCKKRTNNAQSCLDNGDKVEHCSGHDVSKPKITGPHLEDNSVALVMYDRTQSDSGLMTSNCQGDCAGHNKTNKVIDSKPIWEGCAEFREEDHTCTSPCGNTESGTRAEGLIAENSQHCNNNRRKSRKQHCTGSDAEDTISKKGTKNIGKRKRKIRSAETCSADNTLIRQTRRTEGDEPKGIEHCTGSDAENTISKKGRKNIGKRKRKIRGAETCSGDNSQIRQTRRTDGNESTGIVEVADQNADAHGEMRNSEDVSKLTGHDDGEVTLACFLANKSKKLTRAAKRTRVCFPSNSKEGSILPSKEVHHNENPRANHKLVEQQATVLEGVTDTNTGADMAERQIRQSESQLTGQNNEEIGQERRVKKKPSWMHDFDMDKS